MTMQTMIRRATALDAVNILKIIRKSDASLPDNLEKGDELQAVRYVLEIIESGIVFVSEQHGRVVGTIALRPKSDLGVRVLEEEWFAVLPSFRTRPEPYELLKECERIADVRNASISLGKPGTAAQLRGILTRLKSFVFRDGAYVRAPHGQATMAG